MRERGQLVKNPEGEWCAAASVDWTVLPARVEGVIEERLLRLGKDGRDTLAVGSVEGQSFTAEVIAQIRKTDDREIVRRLSTEMSRQHHLVGAAGVERAEAGGFRITNSGTIFSKGISTKAWMKSSAPISMRTWVTPSKRSMRAVAMMSPCS